MKLFNSKFTFWLKLTITSILLIYFVKINDLKLVFETLSKAGIIFIAAAFSMQIITRLIYALKSRIILNHYDLQIPFLRIFAINIITSFYNIVLPGDVLAGGIKILKLSKDSRAYKEVASTVVFSKIMDYSIALILGFLALFFINPFSNELLKYALLGASFLVLLFYIVLYIPRFNDTIVRFFLKALFMLPKSLKGRIEELIRTFFFAYKLSSKKIIALHSISLLLFVLESLTVYILSLSLNLDINILIIFWMRAIVLFLRLLPISLIGAGIREGVFIFVLGLYGVGTLPSFSLAILTTSVLLIIVGLGGIMELYGIILEKKTGNA